MGTDGVLKYKAPHPKFSHAFWIGNHQKMEWRKPEMILKVESEVDTYHSYGIRPTQARYQITAWYQESISGFASNIFLTNFMKELVIKWDYLMSFCGDDNASFINPLHLMPHAISWLSSHFANFRPAFDLQIEQIYLRHTFSASHIVS